ncbi:MAG: InlB B-repeat-containing protein, partial [Gaiellaceae bacterium]
DQTSYDYGTTVTLTATPAGGSQFVNWSGDLTSSANPASLIIDGPKSVTATFALNQFTLNIAIVGSGSVTRSPNQASFASGTIVTLTAVPDAGYHFVGWSGDLSGSTNPVTITMSADKNLTATFAINTYTITLSAVGNGSVSKSPNQATYTHGTAVSVTATPSSGYHLSAWSGDLTGTTNPDTLIMDSDKSVTGTFVINTYTLSITTVGSGTVTKSPDQASYSHGSSATLTATPAVGYHFVGWSGDLSGSASPVPITMDANKSVTATFAINTYALNVSVTGSGAVSKSPNQATYSHGVSVTLLATASAGYHFTGWSGDLTGSANPAAITMDGIKNITATFAANLLVLTVNISGQGSVSRSPDEATYAPGTPVQLQATAAPGYHFTGWSGDLTGTTNPATVSMDVNRLVTATFIANTSPIALENQLPGNPASEWNVIGRGDLTIVGFATDMSVNRGSTQYFKVNT